MLLSPAPVRVLWFALLLLASLIPCSNAAAQGSWIARTRVGNVAYFFHSDRVERFDLTNRAWLAPVVWPAVRGAASAAWADPDGLFAVYGQAIYRYALDGTGELHVHNLNAPINSAGLTSVAGFLVARTAGAFITVDKGTNQFVAERTHYYGSAGLSAAYNGRRVFSRSTGVSPSDVLSLTVSASGTMTLADSPYHGDFPDATQTWTSGDETTVYDSAGTVYAASDLRVRTVLGFSPTDVAHAPGSGAPVVLSGNRLSSYSSNLFPTGTFLLASNPGGILIHGTDVLCFTATPAGIQVQVVPLSALQAPVPGPAVEANGLAYTPDAVLQDKDGVVLLLSKTHQSVFRWDPVAQKYLTSVPLLDTPSYFAYSAPLHRLYIAYANGLIRRIDLTGPAFTEVNFALLGTSARGMLAAGNYCITVEGTNSTGQIRSFAPDGSQVEAFSRYLFSDSDYQWSEILQKIYNSDFSYVYTLEVNANGTAYPSEAPGGIGAQAQFNLTTSFPLPFRISPDGTTIVTAGGGIYQAQTLVRSTSSLANSIADAAWLAGALRTIRTISGQTEFQAWSGAAYTPGLSRQYPGTALRLLPLAGNRLVALSLRSNGVPSFYVVEDDFNLVTPPTLQAPAGLAANLISGSQVDLRWADVSGATGFLVERQQNRGSWSTVGTTGAYVTTISDSTIVAGQTYNYRVSATNGALVSPPSAELALSVTAPPAPNGLTITASSISSVRLTWSSASGASNYTIERKVGANGAFASIGTTTATTTTFQDSAVTSNFLASYRVRASNPLGQSEPSNTVTAQTPALLPNAPVIYGSYSTATSITLSCGLSNNPDFTYVERMTVPGAWAVVRTLEGNVSSFTDTGLTPSTVYSYRARSVNSAGSSGYSNAFQAGTQAPQPPAAPSLLRARTLSASSVRLVWSNVADELGYRIQRRVGESQQWVQAGEVGADATSFDDTGLPSGVQHSYRVVAFSAAGVGAPSNVLTATPFDVVRLVADNFDPGVHAGVWQQILGGEALNQGQGFGGSNVLWFGGGSSRSATTLPQNLATGAYVGFRYRAGNEDVDGPQYWNNSESGEMLVLEFSTGSGWNFLGQLDTAYPAASTWQTVEISLPVEALSAQTSFRIRQAAHSGTSLDTWAIDDFYIDGGRPPAPEAPAFVFAGATSDTQVAISWEAVTGAAGYRVERALGPNGPWLLVVNTFTTTHYTDVQLQPATWFAYRVRAQNAGGNSGWSLLAWAQTYTQLAAWQLANYGSTTTAPAFDADGVATLLKFALGLPAGGSALPYVPGGGTGGLPAIWRDPSSGRLQVEFLRRKASSNPGIAYRVEFSGDLSTWTSSAVLLETQSLDAIWERVRFEDPTTGLRRMGRVAVESQ